MKLNGVVKKANELFRKKQYAEALKLYEELVEADDLWAAVLEFNIENCRRRLNFGKILNINKNNSFENRPKVLVSDFRYPRFDMSAGELATFGIIKMFAELGYDVTFIPKESTELDAPYVRALKRLGVTCVQEVTYEKFKELILEAAKEISIAYIFRPDVAELCVPRIRSVNMDAFIYYHAPDVYFRRERAQYLVESEENKIGTEQLQVIEKRVLAEISAAATSDHIVCVSNGDTEAFREALSNTELNKTGVAPPNISTFPILYLNQKKSLPEFDQTNNICFIGGSEHTPNRDAIRWFLDNVWASVLKELPDLKFDVIGKTDDSEKNYYESFANVRVVGWVDSVEESIVNYRLSVAPLRYGAGIKGKVAVSVISGIPCVASKVAVEDMGFIAGTEVFLAEDAEDYKKKIITLVKEKKVWKNVSKAGARKANDIYSEEATFKRFIRVLNETGNLDTNLYSSFISNIANSTSQIIFPDSVNKYPIDVSIVVPAYNNEHLTRECLTSIHWSMLPAENFSFEVIYADDSSEPDVVKNIKYKFPNVKVTKTNMNSGFVVNSNTGSNEAKGQYLVLLNNDAIVMPNWLSGLLDVIKSVDKCKVAGSKLLYSNSKIQEAGASLWTDGRSCSVGRGIDGTGLDSSLPQFNYIREVDYVSFASVIIDKKVWDEIGGLSTDYGFGYFDDSDFCLQVRSRGGVVLFAPNSEVVHNESASFSKRSRKSVATSRIKNSSIFRKKWEEKLISEHLPYDFPSWDPGYGESHSKAHAERHNIKTLPVVLDLAGEVKEKFNKRILYFSPFPSHPASHGNQTTIQKYGEFLKAEGYSVHFVLLQSHMYSPKDVKDMESAWDTLDIIKIPYFPSCDGNTIRYDGWYIPGLGEQIAFLCSKYAVETIICSYIFQSRILDFVPSYILKVLDTHDKFTDRYEILDKLRKPREFFSCTRQEEGAYLSRADVVLARRDEERDYFDAISTAKVYTVPHIEDRSYLDKANAPLRKLGMVASCNLINLDIVIKFIAELIRQKGDDWGFEVFIAGEVKSLINYDDPVQSKVAAHPLVSFLGYVDNIRDFYQDVDLIVCPIMSGTGINVKTVQALAYGMPILATQHASKGIPTTCEEHLYKDVSSMVSDLLTKTFESDRLGELVKRSIKVYENYIEIGYENFRKSLRLSQDNIRNDVGNSLKSSLDTIFSDKSRIVNNAIMRKIGLGREYLIKSIVDSLEDFGPNWINMNDPLPNIQNDGGVGFWFRFKSPIKINGEIFLNFCGISSKMYLSDDARLLTTSLPSSSFSQQGNLNLEIDVRFDFDNQAGDHEKFKLAILKLVRE